MDGKGIHKKRKKKIQSVREGEKEFMFLLVF
jgi:hypothetical protein